MIQLALTGQWSRVLPCWAFRFSVGRMAKAMRVVTFATTMLTVLRHAGLPMHLVVVVQVARQCPYACFHSELHIVYLRHPGVPGTQVQAATSCLAWLFADGVHVGTSPQSWLCAPGAHFRSLGR
jgi:hypothetical protein